MTFQKKRIGIVGAGPVGSLLAAYLAQQGIESEIFERRPDMRNEKVHAGRSINLAVSTRGLFALREIGLEEKILKEAIPMRGRMIHSQKGELTFQPYGLSENDCINSMSRQGINQHLMTHAEKTGRVTIHFNQKVKEIELSTRIVQIQDQMSGDEQEIEKDIWFATDGSGSPIRKALMNRPGSVCHLDYLDYGYKELTIPAGPQGQFKLEKNALHIWPRGNYMLIALPNYEGSFTCTLFLPFEGPQSFESLQFPRQVEAFFKDQFPDVYPLIPELAQAYFGNPTGSMVTVNCTPWNFEDKVLLLGDSAHAIVPFFGQGMNCGFEDCTVLNHLMKSLTDQHSLFQMFFQLRKPQADAIAEMAVENFFEMRNKVGDSKFLLEKSVEKMLQKKFPGEFVSRYSLVTFSRVPYQLARRAGVVGDEILNELCRNIQYAEDVDMIQAERLIRSKLKPLFSNENWMSGVM
jgi:kynurenine 3-monooxygenase